MQAIDFHPRTRCVFGPGSFDRLSEFVTGRRVLLVADRGLPEEYRARAVRLLEGRGEVWIFDRFEPNPDSEMIEDGRGFAEPLGVESIVALGGGSAMDTAKGINFLLTNGGPIHQYHGYGKASRPMLPAVGVPTTAGTGSEAQSYCLISDAGTHMKMACGDPKAAFHTAVLDPELTLTQPAAITASAGYDALSHAVEAFVSNRQTAVSRMFAREAFGLIEPNLEHVLFEPSRIESRGAMLLGAFLAGCAIENSMLGATHACANPLTAHYGTTHGVAIALMLHHVVRWNAGAVDYASLYPHGLADRLKDLARAAGMPATLRGAGVESKLLPVLAQEAAQQWTGKFNPRPLDVAAAFELYKCAY